jgi:hypothetical protein
MEKWNNDLFPFSHQAFGLIPEVNYAGNEGPIFSPLVASGAGDALSWSDTIFRPPPIVLFYICVAALYCFEPYNRFFASYRMPCEPFNPGPDDGFFLFDCTYMDSHRSPYVGNGSVPLRL